MPPTCVFQAPGVRKVRQFRKAVIDTPTAVRIYYSSAVTGLADPASHKFAEFFGQKWIGM